MDDEGEQLADEVAERLRSLGLNAGSWNSGGGMVGVAIARGTGTMDDLRFFFGRAGDVWAGEVFNDEGEVESGLRTSVPAAASDSKSVAASIVSAIAAFAASA